MSIKRMLIDATQAEELRVAVVNDERLEEFESETATKIQNKGNIYLAKVVRIEPSLQAAFVDYGGDRHGFLPFNEIHPDYYRIPVADRKKFDEALKASQAREELMADADIELADLDEEASSESKPASAAGDTENAIIASLNELNDESEEADGKKEDAAEATEAESEAEPEIVETKGEAQEATSAASSATLYKQYKIQEVIKRRHIMLVQIVKEERGNKGASLTTYLSLPGRYCVLMPNAGHRSGGVSRKIADVKDRRRLRQILSDLSLPDETGLIVRTAGAKRSKSEIKRDYDYLIRLWREIREKTLKSIAPSTIYSEGDLIQRAIRDIYDRDIEEVLVEGEAAYKAAKNFMKSLTPSHAKRVKHYKEENSSLFHKYKVEKQIDEMMSPTAPLPSGGSIVINPTEALVAIDVNSGRATRERHIEETAYKTNVEAAHEIARQIRLRDLAGIIVIDFIDMNDNKRVQTVERKFREAIHFDRARIQTSRISQFGLMELSRQRLRPSILESNSISCQSCHGTGLVRSVESFALGILRAAEDYIIENKREKIIIKVPIGVDEFLLNRKRKDLVDLENNFKVTIQIIRDERLVAPDYSIIDEQVPAKPQAESKHKSASQAQSPAQGESKEKPAREQRRGPRRRRPDDKNRDKNPAKEADKTVQPATPPSNEKKDASKDSVSATPDTQDKIQQTDRPQRSRNNLRNRRRRSGRRNEQSGQQQPGQQKTEGGGSEGSNDKSASQASGGPDLRVIKTPHGSAKSPAKAPVTTSTPDIGNDGDKQGKKGWWQRLLES